MPGKLQDKIAIVTGASSGLGRAITLHFAREGARIICADLVPTARTAVEEEAIPTHEMVQEKYGEKTALFVKCDVSSEEDIKAVVAKAVEWGGRLDIMVNNAGIAGERSYEQNIQRFYETQ